MTFGPRILAMRGPFAKEILMYRSGARFETAHGSRYLQQLCKHFAHKLEVRYSETEAEAVLPTGTMRLRADAAGLHAEVTAEDLPGLIQARFVIDKHLVTFAFRDGFSGFPWALEKTPPRQP